jgi:hypothetical protein
MSKTLIADGKLYSKWQTLFETDSHGDETPLRFSCYTVTIPQGLRKFTLVEVASGHDMTMEDHASALVRRLSAQESPDFSHGERSIAYALPRIDVAETDRIGLRRASCRWHG